MIDFGNRLKTLRLKAEMSQADLAKKLSLTKSVISAYENDMRMPSYDVLIHLSKIFKVSTDYLLGNETKSLVLDLSGLTDEEIAALIQLIRAMKHS